MNSCLTNNENVKHIIMLRACEKEICNALLKLSNLCLKVLRTFEIYQSYIFQKFISRIAEEESLKINAFIALAYDKVYYQHLKDSFEKQGEIKSKKRFKEILLNPPQNHEGRESK